jgi:hypothetical protein
LGLIPGYYTHGQSDAYGLHRGGFSGVGPSDAFEIGVGICFPGAAAASVVAALLVANVTRTTSWPSTGSFVVGRHLYNNAPSSYHSGQISTVEVWDQTIDPTK